VFLHAQKTTFKGFESLRCPANNVTGKTFRVTISSWLLIFQGCECVRMRGVFPNLVSIGMTVITRITSSKSTTSLMSHRRQAKTLSPSDSSCRWYVARRSIMSSASPHRASSGTRWLFIESSCIERNQSLQQTCLCGQAQQVVAPFSSTGRFAGGSSAPPDVTTTSNCGKDFANDVLLRDFPMREEHSDHTALAALI